MLTPPRSIRLEASTVCQLKCLDCSQSEGKIKKHLGEGFLTLENFKKVVDENPNVCYIELSNWGEIFLNPHLANIIKYAYKKNVILTASNGANLNTLSEEMPEILVKFQFDRITCSVDGASQDTYGVYRKNGDFGKVIEHIKKINYFKSRYRSVFPLLKWQFILFSHNERDIPKAKKIAEALNMSFEIKLPWGSPGFNLKNKSLVKKFSGPRATTSARICTQLWAQPQINFDGQLLGCCYNYWGSFGNVFEDGLLQTLNNIKMNSARQLLSGKGRNRSDTPCLRCHYYKMIKKQGSWIKEDEIKFLPGKDREKTALRKRLIKSLRTKVLLKKPFI